MNRKQRRAEKKAPADALALHADGVQAFVAGQPDKAASLIAQAIAANDQMPDFHYNLGIVLKAQGKLKQAAASYGRAIALKPDYADAHNNLGNVWKEMGDPDKARASFQRALEIKPGNPGTHYSLGLLFNDMGEREQAARHFQLCLAQDLEDSRGARHLLARMGLAIAPGQTSPAQLLKIYDVRSRFWDRESSYFAHTLVADALHAHAPPEEYKLDILDIGCGTGLVGAAVRASARRLDGVDLSPAMLEKAHAKSIYDRLEQGDIVTALFAHKNSYDAILGAAVLIHFGDLGAVFQAAAHSLRASGLFVFTLFPGEDADFAVCANNRLAQSGCYAHSPAYIERLARECGFSAAELEQVVHEQDQDGNPVPGLLVVLRRDTA